LTGGAQCPRWHRRETPAVARDVRSPLGRGGGGRISADRHSAVVELAIRGPADGAGSRAQPVLDAVAALQHVHRASPSRSSARRARTTRWRKRAEWRSRRPERLTVRVRFDQTDTRELLSDWRGGSGYVLKDRIFDVGEFVDAVRRVGRGGTALDPAVVAQLFSGRREDSRLAALTAREREVLGLMAEGRSNTAIAAALVLSVGAVEKHIASIFAQLRMRPSGGDHRRVLAVLAYLQDETTT
jgi:DNA-binding CsgD family transcriptional regulator